MPFTSIVAACQGAAAVEAAEQRNEDRVSSLVLSILDSQTGLSFPARPHNYFATPQAHQFLHNPVS